MYYNGIIEGTPTVADVQHELNAHLAKITTVAPHNLTYFVTEVEELRGQLAALTEVTEDFANIADAAAEHGWTADQTLVRKLQAVLILAERASGKSLQFSDDYSGRNNDNRRSFRDGWVNILASVRRDLDNEARALYSSVNA